MNEMIKLHQGLALKLDGAYLICRSGSTRIVALMGPIGCGKTTLIAAIFQAFLGGPVAGYSFRRSDTLVAFEEKCFNSRTASDADLASTPRTSGLVGAEYYHLEVQNDDDGSIHRLLILDLSGEIYEAAIHLQVDAAKLNVLQDVDVLVHLIDGQKLASGATREKVYSDAKALFRRLTEVQAIRTDTPLQMVVSKMDQLVADDLSELAIADVEARVRARFVREAQRADFQVREIAASPAPETRVPMRFGVPGLFQSWLVTKEVPDLPLAKIRSNSPRLMHRLGEVWMPERYECSE
jgi:hypothetical protein